MRIGVNARLLLKDRIEGIGRYIYESTREMVKNHPDDDFILFFDRPYDESFVFGPNVTPVIVPPQARHPVLYRIWFEWMLPRAFRKYHIDVFYSGDTYMSLSTDVPTLIVSHDIGFKHFPEHLRGRDLRFYKRYYPLFHHKAAHIIAVSDFTKQDIIKAYGLPENKISVGYSCPAEGFFPLSKEEKQKIRKKLTAGNPYFFYVGSLHPRKNVSRLIMGFDRFKKKTKSDHKLVLVGRMAWKTRELQDTYHRISHKEDIIFAGSISGSIAPYMGASDGLMFVSIFEGFGLPIVEAMRCGVPVVTGDTSSMPEISGGAAILVDPFSVEDIAQSMDTLSNDHDLVKSLISKGHQRAKDFSWQKTSSLIYDRLSEISR